MNKYEKRRKQFKKLLRKSKRPRRTKAAFTLSSDEIAIIFSFLPKESWRSVALTNRQFQELLLLGQSNTLYPVFYFLNNQERHINTKQVDKILMVLKEIAFLHFDVYSIRDFSFKSLDPLLLSLGRLPELQEDISIVQRGVVNLMKITSWYCVTAMRCTAFPEVMERGLLAFRVFHKEDTNAVEDWRLLDCAFTQNSVNFCGRYEPIWPSIEYATLYRHSGWFKSLVPQLLLALNNRVCRIELSESLKYHYRLPPFDSEEEVVPCQQNAIDHVDTMIQCLFALVEDDPEHLDVVLLQLITKYRPNLLTSRLSYFSSISDDDSPVLKQLRSSKEYHMRKIEKQPHQHFESKSVYLRDLQALELVLFGRVTTPNAPHEIGMDFTKCMTQPIPFQQLLSTHLKLRNKDLIFQLIAKYPQEPKLTKLIHPALLQDKEVLRKLSLSQLMASECHSVHFYIVSNEKRAKLALNSKYSATPHLLSKLKEKYGSIPKHFFDFVEEDKDLLLDETIRNRMVAHCGSLDALLIQCIQRNPNVIVDFHRIGFRFSSFSKSQQELIFSHLLNIKSCDCKGILETFHKEGLFHKNLEFFTSFIAKHTYMPDNISWYHPDIYRKMLHVNPSKLPRFICEHLDIAEFVMMLQEVPEILKMETGNFIYSASSVKHCLLFVHLKHRKHAAQFTNALMCKTIGDNKCSCSKMISHCFALAANDVRKSSFKLAAHVYRSLLKSVIPKPIDFSLDRLSILTSFWCLKLVK